MLLYLLICYINWIFGTKFGGRGTERLWATASMLTLAYLHANSDSDMAMFNMYCLPSSYHSLACKNANIC